MEIYYEPSFSDKFLGVIKCWEDDKTLLASSSLIGQYWGGRLWCFANPDGAVAIESWLTNADVECGIVDILCMSEGKTVIGLDSGAIDIYQLHDDPTPAFFTLGTSHEHHDMVTSLSMTCDNLKFASSSCDKSIKIWDVETWASISTFRPIHNGTVHQVACSTTDPSVLLSCGQDGKILLIDLRLPKPASVLDSDHSIQKPAIAWKPQSNTVFASGDHRGFITIRDIRKISEKFENKEHNRPIFKLGFSPHNPSLLAACADDTKVIVVDVDDDKASSIYTNDVHQDLVRGLAWTSKNDLLTCGFDRKVIQHSIPSSQVTTTLTNGSQEQN